MRILLLTILSMCIGHCNRAIGQSLSKQFPRKIEVVITNPLAAERNNVLVRIPISDIQSKAKDFNVKGFVVVDNNIELASQFNQRDGDNSGVVFVLDRMGPSERRSVFLQYHPSDAMPRSYAKRTQAELSRKTGGSWKKREYVGGQFENVQYLSVPPEHKDHSWFLRYEGPGWESDKVAYRFYLDQRNAVDVFGKKVKDPVLQNIGKDGFDSYHEMQPWGMDVLKVGNSLGLGSIASLVDGAAMRVEKTDSVSCRILENGPIFSSFITKYSGWSIGNSSSDLRVTTSIHAGTRLTKQSLKVTQGLPNISTGIGKDANAPMITSMGDEKSFGYIATYGKQSLNADDIGLAVFFNPSDFQSFTEDAHSHIVVLNTGNGALDYYFAAAWILEPGGIKNQKEFEVYLAQTARDLANPVSVEIKSK